MSKTITVSAMPASPNVKRAEQAEVLMLEAALDLARHGFPVFPIHTPLGGSMVCTCRKPECPKPGKHPRTKNGFKDATTDEAQISRWWSMWPDANIGVPTGGASRFFVLDRDPRNGSEASFPKLGEMPETPSVETGGGGWHYWFLAPDPAPRCEQNALPGIDIKCEGGYVVAPPSLHESGERYRWLVTLDEAERAPTPQSVIEILGSSKSRHGATERACLRDKAASAALSGADRGRLASYSGAALARCAAVLAAAEEGARNNELNRQSFLVGRYVGANLLGRQDAEEALLEAALGAGLSEHEINKTLASGLDAGIEQAHDVHALLHRLGEARPADCVQATENAPLEPGFRPTIFLTPGELPQVLDQADAALQGATEDRVYQRGSLLVRLVRTTALSPDEAIRRQPGTPILVPLDVPSLSERLTKVAEWYRPSAGDGPPRRKDCPDRIAKALLSRAGNWRSPSLISVIEAPTMRPDGSLLVEPGYDPETCLYFSPGGTEFPPIPVEPTLDQARAALQLLATLVEEFPFVAASDRSTALAAILTALVRRSLRTAPLFAFRAPKRGSGKTLLADLVGILATGRDVSLMSQGRDEDEDRKRLFSLLLEGASVACIDNIERPLESSALCSILTGSTWKDRILGLSKTAEVPTSTTFLATGNNVQFVGDLASRVLISDIYPEVERPEEREFGRDLREYAPKHRGALVSAALTILRAYHVAGRPSQGLSVFGRFEGWSDLPRSALVWCGEADPVEGRRRIEESDPIRELVAGVLTGWSALIGAEKVTTKQVVERATRSRADDGFLEALCEASGSGDREPSPRRLGHWLKRYEGRIEDGLRLQKCGERHHSALWRVVDAPR